MDFEIVGSVSEPETFASGKQIRELSRLRKTHGEGNWRKRKGNATVRLPNGEIVEVELHWYEAHGIGKVEYKIKQYF